MAKSSISSKYGSYSSGDPYGYMPEAVEEKRFGSIRPRTGAGEEFYPESYKDLYDQYPEYRDYINELQRRFYSPRLIYRFILRGVAERKRVSGEPIDTGVTPTMLPSGRLGTQLRPGGAYTGEEVMELLEEKKRKKKMEQEEVIRQAEMRRRVGVTTTRQAAPAAPAEVQPALAQEPAPFAGKRAPSYEELQSGLSANTKRIAKIQEEVADLEKDNAKLLERRNKIKARDIGGKEYNDLSNQMRSNDRLINSKRNAISDLENRTISNTIKLDAAAAKKSASELKAGATASEKAQIDEINSWIEENSKVPDMASVVELVSKQFGQKRRAGLTVQNIIDSANAEIMAAQQRADAKIAEREEAQRAAEEENTQADIEKQRGNIQGAIDKKRVAIAQVRAVMEKQGFVFDGNGDISAYPASDSIDDKNSMGRFTSAYTAYRGGLAELERQLGMVGSSNESGSTAGGMTEQEQEAYNWAISNPNDPRAAQILTSLGM